MKTRVCELALSLLMLLSLASANLQNLTIQGSNSGFHPGDSLVVTWSSDSLGLDPTFLAISLLSLDTGYSEDLTAAAGLLPFDQFIFTSSIPTSSDITTGQWVLRIQQFFTTMFSTSSISIISAPFAIAA
ncbi:uncharacterized protein BJ171DRAFT_517888 [Polychytrium aggregatum]|uniref:uncharacterized protein n=1 Tax=Polychytrium aggregatum TaxID=110093 RepID=UPI0022FE7B76|nr:uncharacterized protein BJ171DRAFT_517888 [Polychytrium aggregatum]KAI9199546.1 hypothetical protein BJ171DRAFT_517888 [Polychytrium aggregatum]